MLSGARIERLAREFDRELRRLEARAITRLVPLALPLVGAGKPIHPELSAVPGGREHD